MDALLSNSAYRDLLSMARRHARGRIEAEDLLQEAMVVALADGRGFKACDKAWLGGVMRNIAAMKARSAARRRRREDGYASLITSLTPDSATEAPSLTGLSTGLRIVALLVLAGQTRREIRHLLRISDEALRQRIAGLRRHWKNSGSAVPSDIPALRDGLAFGSIRRGLLPIVRAGRADFASHDPDGHLVAFTIARR